jgi:hypothetical protein
MEEATTPLWLVIIYMGNEMPAVRENVNVV